MKAYSKLIAIVAALAIATGGSFALAQSTVPAVTPPASTAGTGQRRGTAGPRAGRGDQPRMREAILRLQEARRLLDEAEHDKGGFREKAIKSTDVAIKDVQDGIDYADAHPEEFRGPRGARRGAATTPATTPPPSP